MWAANPVPQLMSAGLRATLSTVALMGFAATANAETVSDLLAPSMAGKVFFVSEAPGYFTSVPAIGEVWQVDAGGSLLDRGKLQYFDGLVLITWQGSTRIYLPTDMVLDASAETVEVDLARLVSALVEEQSPLEFDAFPSPLRFTSALEVQDAKGAILGSWAPMVDGIGVTFEDQAPVLVSAAALAGALANVEGE